MDSKVIQLCPECLKKLGAAGATVQCPKHGNTPICMAHCYNKCNYLDKSMSLARCTYSQRIKKEREVIGHKKISLH